MNDIKKENNFLEEKSATEILKWAYSNFNSDDIKLSTSFGAEGVVIIDLLKRFLNKFNVFTIDTGRHFNETYQVWQEIVEKYNIDIETVFPDPEDLNLLNKQKGPDLFYKSVQDRKDCCYVRKIKPLFKGLRDTKLWITGLRREQSSHREKIDIISWDNEYKVYKLYPLAKWTEGNVWDYIRNNQVPYNKLYDQGYLSIGCEPCSRPSRPAEGKRDNRWWWEQDEKKECGIHISNGKVQRKKEPINWNI